jgi:ATP-dependent DNA helicase PIF1
VIQHLRKKYERQSSKNVYVTASTGIAASHIGGTTLHSFAGIGLGHGEKEKILSKVLRKKADVGRWKQTAVLIVDEISMVDSGLFTTLEYVARGVRKSTEPFGGIQLLLCGDFFQLPPVKATGFSFESPAWRACKIKTFELNKVERQKDPIFVGHLHKCRIGVCTEDFTQLLRQTHIYSKRLPDDGISPTKVYCVNRDVDKENAERLAQLPGDTYTFEAKDVYKHGRSNEGRLADLMEKKVPSVIQLKVRFHSMPLLIFRWAHKSS